MADVMAELLEGSCRPPCPVGLNVLSTSPHRLHSEVGSVQVDGLGPGTQSTLQLSCVRVDGGPDGRVEAVAAECGELVALALSCTLSFSSAKTSRVPACPRSSSRSSSMSAAVVSMSVIGSAATMIQPVGVRSLRGGVPDCGTFVRSRTGAGRRTGRWRGGGGGRWSGGIRCRGSRGCRRTGRGGLGAATTRAGTRSGWTCRRRWRFLEHAEEGDAEECDKGEYEVRAALAS